MPAINVRGHLVRVDAGDVQTCLSLKLRIVDKTRHAKRKLYCEHCYRGPDGKNVHVSLHRIILGIRDPEVLVDHVNGDGLDCQRANLRVATRAENARNAAPHSNRGCGLRGVYFHSGSGRWRAQIQAGGARRSLGTFDTSEAAKVAYDAAAAELHGKFRGR